MNTDKKCKPIPEGYTVREDGFLVKEGWSAKYKKSIDCNNPKGFSQKAHCAGKKKKMTEESNPRIARKKVQPAKSKKHSDLYTDESVEVDAIVKADEVTKVDEVKKDYDYTRGNLYSLIEKGQEAINGIMEVAGETASPRAYEVAGQLIKSVADTTDKLADLHKKVKEIEEDNPKTQSTVTNNALFVGSTSELSKMLKDGILNSNNSE